MFFRKLLREVVFINIVLELERVILLKSVKVINNLFDELIDIEELNNLRRYIYWLIEYEDLCLVDFVFLYWFVECKNDICDENERNLENILSNCKINIIFKKWC